MTGQCIQVHGLRYITTVSPKGGDAQPIDLTGVETAMHSGQKFSQRGCECISLSGGGAEIRGKIKCVTDQLPVRGEPGPLTDPLHARGRRRQPPLEPGKDRQLPVERNVVIPGKAIDPVRRLQYDVLPARPQHRIGQVRAPILSRYSRAQGVEVITVNKRRGRHLGRMAHSVRSEQLNIDRPHRYLSHKGSFSRREWLALQLCQCRVGTVWRSMVLGIEVTGLLRLARIAATVMTAVKTSVVGTRPMYSKRPPAPAAPNGIMTTRPKPAAASDRPNIALGVTWT